uniref:2-oxoglutarate dehydrogenase E1 component/KDG C-terminal domain-containing protein n=1 Tax=Meloidogyne enterolobii TaxID=390850 RepID=A0A6V7TPW0_MELEN|nr:unnamed protein product [Meloidogyne enterolobii]
MCRSYLLRHPLARSSIESFLTGTSFQRVGVEEGKASENPANVKRVVFCSGKVYYDILLERKKRGLEADVALARVEQISPFPYDLLIQECNKYSNADIIWAQEEHKNMGAWTFIQPRFLSFLKKSNRGIIYAGRKPSASPATGNKFIHQKEQAEMLEAILVKPVN